MVQPTPWLVSYHSLCSRCTTLPKTSVYKLCWALKKSFYIKPDILHRSAHFLLLFRGCYRINGCQQQGGPQSSLCYQCYQQSVCIWLLLDSIPTSRHFMHWRHQWYLTWSWYTNNLCQNNLCPSCLKSTSTSTEKNALYIQNKCTVCILKHRPLLCIIMMETHKNIGHQLS